MDKQKHIESLKARMVEVLEEKQALMDEIFMRGWSYTVTDEELERIRGFQDRYNELAVTKCFLEVSLIPKREPWEPDEIY